jgi:hypothetical protein
MRLLVRTCLIFISVTILWADTDIPCNYTCGDSNADGAVDVGDAVYLINHIFGDGPFPLLPEASDANSDGQVNIGDAVSIINYVFRLGDSPICPDLPSDCGVIITDMPPDSIQLDPHDLLAVEIEGNVISIVTAYSGGCREHFFWLYMSPSCFLESHPVQANLFLKHFANGDDCDAYITDTASFDLTPVGELYILQYGQPDTIIINVFDYFEDEPAGKISAIYYPDL